jgi:sugar phosphate isomerase/epimerase
VRQRKEIIMQESYTHFVGLDWANDHHDVVILDRAGQIVADFRFAHSPAGWERFHEQVKPFPALAFAERVEGGDPSAISTAPGEIRGLCRFLRERYSGPKTDMYQQEHDELFASIRSGKPINNGEWMAHSTLLAIMGRMAAYAKRYGASSVLLVPAVVNQDVSYADAYTRSQAEIRQAVPLAEELGVKIAIENVWNHFLLSPLEAARYVDEFRSPAVGSHFDVGNVINNGWPEQWIRILGPRIQKLHIKEFSRKKRDQEGLWKGFAVEFLTGDNNWPAVMKAVDDVNYRGWAIVEPAWKPEGVAPAERLQQMSGKLDQILAS